MDEKELLKERFKSAVSSTVRAISENFKIFRDVGYAFRVTFINKCDDLEKNIIAEYYQRCFGEDLPESTINIKI